MGGAADPGTVVGDEDRGERGLAARADVDSTGASVERFLDELLDDGGVVEYDVGCVDGSKGDGRHGAIVYVCGCVVVALLALDFVGAFAVAVGLGLDVCP